MYDNEINAIRRSGRHRSREIFDTHLRDFASNDYLGLAEYKSTLSLVCQKLYELPCHSPKASPLVNGYSEQHRLFEEELCLASRFERGVILGSGFLANLALIESLVRRDDLLLLDSEYHASGMLASKTVQGRVELFDHNDPDDLENKTKQHKTGRILIGIEGVYSMSGDIGEKEISDIADRYNAILLVDEAHSGGTIGESLLGWFEHHGITPQENHIRMGTLGKAYGSYGAYILASEHIVGYLENRAKALIYSTALSLFDTMLAHENFKYVRQNHNRLSAQIAERLEIASAIFGRQLDTPIVPIPVRDSGTCLRLKNELMQQGFLVGAIRPPTVESPILRVILRTSNDMEQTTKLLNWIAGAEGVL